MKRRLSITLPEIPAVAKTIAQKLQGGEVLALIGDLGSGKTAFTKALAKNLKVKGRVTSPTFVLMNVFYGSLPRSNKQILLLHLDLYRLNGWEEIKPLGFTELWKKQNVVTVVEWADKIKKHLPKNVWILKFIHEVH